MAQTTSLVFNGGSIPSPAPAPTGSGKAKLLKIGEIDITEQGVQVTKKVICDPDSVTAVEPFMEVLTSAKLAELVESNSIIVLDDGDMQYLMANANITVEEGISVCTAVNFLGLSKENRAKVAYNCTRIADELTLQQVVEVGEPVETDFNLVIADSEDTAPNTLINKMEVVSNEREPDEPAILQLETTVDGQGNHKVAINEDNLRTFVKETDNAFEDVWDSIGELPNDEHGYFNSSLYTTPGDGTTESILMDNFRISQGRDVHGDNIEFVVTHQEDGVDFGEVYLNPGTYILNVHYTLQYVGNPRGTFHPLVTNVGEQPFDFSYEHEDILRTTRIVTRTTRGKFGLKFPFDADTPPMGIWVKYLEIAQIASYNHPAVTHDTTLAGSGQIGDPLGVTTGVFGKVKDIPTSISQFRTGDVIPVDGPNGPAKMPKNDLLNETAQNALAGNMAPAFDPTRTSDNKYLPGEKVLNNGRLKVAAVSHYGAFSNNDFFDGYAFELEDLQTAKKMNIIGKGFAGVNKWIFFATSVDKIAVRVSPNPWPTDTIGGDASTVICELKSIAASGSQTTLTAYNLGSSIPTVITLNIPSGAVGLRIFVRANSDASVQFVLSNPYVDELPSQKTLIDNAVSSICDHFDSTKNYNVGEPVTYNGVAYKAIYPHSGSWDSSHFVKGNVFCLQDFDSAKKMSFVGGGLTARNLYIFLSVPVDKLVMTSNPSPWPTDTIGGSNPAILMVYAVSALGTETLVKYYYYGTPIPSRLELSLPSGTKALRLFVRANNGASVELFLENYVAENNSFVTVEDARKIKSMAMSYGNVLKNFVLMGDPHGSKYAFDAYKKMLTEYPFDSIIVLGDICPDNPVQDNAYTNWNDFVSGVSTLILPVIGNHDVGSQMSLKNYIPLPDVVKNVMKPCVDKGFITTTYGYYYKDVGDIRIIVINNYNKPGVYDADSLWERIAYDSSNPQIAFGTSYNQNEVVNIGVWTDYSYKAKEPLTTPASNPLTLVHNFPCWSSRPDGASIDSAQAQWVLDTMLATPANMGIVIVSHASMATNFFVDKNSKFSQKYDVAAELSGVGDFFVDAVEAYNSGESFSTTVDGVSVSADFSSKNNSVFVGFVSGHQHRDLILRSITKPKYYSISANMSIPSYVGWPNDIWVNQGDLSATIASFDRYRKSTNVLKLGVELTCDGYKRDNDRIEQSYTE